MRIPFLPFLGIVMALAIGLWAPVHALHQGKEPSEIAREADYIVVGTIAEQQSRWHEKKALLYTEVTVRVEEAVKAPFSESTPSQVTVRVPGGRRGELVMRVSDVPEFKPQERVLLFLKRGQPEGICTLVAGAHGCFWLVGDPELEQEVLVNEVGAFLVSVEGQRYEKQAPSHRKVTFPQFRRYLREILHTE